MKKIAVYCGSSTGSNPIYQENAKLFGQLMVNNGLDLIYGGGAIGIMGCLADTVLHYGGSVFGVIPEFLDKVEITHRGLTELHVTENMPDRKAKMYDLADGFVALPGGIGTMEELFEVFTWKQLQIHNKPIGILNTNGYFDYLLTYLEHMVKEGFLQSLHKDLILVRDDPESLIAAIHRSVS